MPTTINIKCRHKPPQTGEAGFTLVEMVIVIVLASILGIFAFGMLTNCLVAQRDMQARKEKSDDAIISIERMNRELKEANWIMLTGTDRLVFGKNVTSSVDTNLFVAYVRDPATKELLRRSVLNQGDFPWIGPPNWIAPSGTPIATNVDYFGSTDTSGRVAIGLEFDKGSYWQTRMFPRNNNL